MKKHFVTGLVILLPLTLTVLIVIFVLNFLTKPFMGIVTRIFSTMHLGKFHTQIFSHEQIVKFASQFIIIIVLIVVTFVLGILARWVIFNWIIKISDKILSKIPLINKVYKTTQDIVKTILVTDKSSFKQVVMVPYPYRGIYSIGLVSRESPVACRQSSNEDLISVFVATTPNPTTGFLLLYKREDLVYLDMKTEDAVKYIVSCGVIIPDGKIKEKK